MKRTTILLLTLALFIVQGTSVVQAQGVNDAFYIYQNDGHFNGFFYDEVIEIRYSKLDTLNMEHSDFVSQEIVTADSTYRIMLAAIDSVGFVQPEIKMNERVYDLGDYYSNWAVWSHEGQTFLLYNPYGELGELRVGDIIFNNAPYDEAPYAGKITSLSNTSIDYRGTTINALQVTLEPVTDIHDIFQQFTTIEQYSATEDGRILSRRVAGMPHMGVGKYAPGSVVRTNRADYWTKDLLNFSFSGTVQLNESNPEVNLIPNIEGKFNIRAEWDLPQYIGITTTAYYGLGIGLEVDGVIGKDKELNPPLDGLVSIPLPAAAPLFQLQLTPNLFLRGEAHIKFAVQSPKYRGKVWTKFEVQDYLPAIKFGATQSNTVENETDQEYYAQPNEASASLSFEGWAQLGAKFPIKLKANTLLSYIFDCGVGITLYVGPRISAQFAIDAANLAVGDRTLYNTIKDTKITLNPVTFDFKANGYFKKFWSGDLKEISYDLSLKPIDDIDFLLLPEFGDWKEMEKTGTEKDGDYNGKTFQALAIKPIPWSHTIGEAAIGIQSCLVTPDGKEHEDRAHWEVYKGTDVKWVSEANWPLYLNLERFEERPGPYRMYPVISRFGMNIFVPKPYEYQTKTAYILTMGDTLKVDAASGTVVAPIKTNCTEIKGTVPGCKGATVEITGEQVSVTLPPKKGVLPYEDTVDLEGLKGSSGSGGDSNNGGNGEGNYPNTASRSITIHQEPTGHITELSICGETIPVNLTLPTNGTAGISVSGELPGDETWEKKEYTIDLVLDTSYELLYDEWGHYSYVKKPAVTGGGCQIKRTGSSFNGSPVVELETVTVTEPWEAQIPNYTPEWGDYFMGLGCSEHTIVKTWYDSEGKVTDTDTQRNVAGDLRLK